MFGPIITYEFCKSLHADRLEEAEQARLVSSLKTENPTIRVLKQWRRFIVKGGMIASRVQNRFFKPKAWVYLSLVVETRNHLIKPVQKEINNATNYFEKI